MPPKRSLIAASEWQDKDEERDEDQKPKRPPRTIKLSAEQYVAQVDPSNAD